MSWASLADAAVTRLRSQLTLTAETVQIRRKKTGEPNLNSPAQVFIAVHQLGGHRHDDVAASPATYSFGVTISVKHPGQGREPPDRDDRTMDRTTYGLDALVAVVYTALHGQPGGYAVLDAASTAGWIEPPLMTTEGEQEARYEGWLSQTMEFAGAKRVIVGSGIN